MPKDGLRRLPDHVVAPLLRALMCIPRTPDARLILQPVKERRAPFWRLEDDYNVVYRGKRVGRIDRKPNPYPSETHVPWRWFLDYSREGATELSDERRKILSGRAASRGEAMIAFRRAFESILHGDAGQVA